VLVKQLFLNEADSTILQPRLERRTDLSSLPEIFDLPSANDAAIDKLAKTGTPNLHIKRLDSREMMVRTRARVAALRSRVAQYAFADGAVAIAEGDTLRFGPPRLRGTTTKVLRGIPPRRRNPRS
jgi:hypothetical protein